MLRCVFSVVFATAVTVLAGDKNAYVSSIEDWRQQREAKLKAEDGWLSLAGLFWLQEGTNAVGSKAGSRVQLPEDFPVNTGAFVRHDNAVTYNGKPLKTDKSGDPDVIPIGRLRLYVIERGTKLGVRMKDPKSKARTGFKGLQWFPVKPEWRINARFVPQPKHITLDAQAGDKQEYESPGYIEWERAGKTVRLTPVREDDQLFFVFRDATAGKSTYSAARFIYTDLPKDGHVLIDFNKAYNPPCVFTPYATCPLPPAENRVRMPVDAGEKMYVGHP